MTKHLVAAVAVVLAAASFQCPKSEARQHIVTAVAENPDIATRIAVPAALVLSVFTGLLFSHKRKPLPPNTKVVIERYPYLPDDTEMALLKIIRKKDGWNYSLSRPKINDNQFYFVIKQGNLSFATTTLDVDDLQLFYNNFKVDLNENFINVIREDVKALLLESKVRFETELAERIAKDDARKAELKQLEAERNEQARQKQTEELANELRKLLG